MREKNAQTLAAAGISRPGLAVGASSSPSFIQNPGLVGAPPPAPSASFGLPRQASGDFASDYGDPRLSGAGIPGLPSTAALSGPLGTSPALEELMLAQSAHTQLKCPKCDTTQPASHKVCSNCGADLTAARKAKFANLGDETEADLLLSAGLDKATRTKFASEGKALPDGSYPIDNAEHLKSAISLVGHSKKYSEDDVKKHIKKRAAALGLTESLPESWSRGPGPDKSNMSADGHAASFFSKLDLAEKRADGLIWKAICKTGELALSPGPGQVDVEKPLVLSSELFQELERSVKEQAFPYVTVPISHSNGLLENSGFVRALSREPSKDPADPPGTELLMAGIEFTEPTIRAKVENGSIPDTSIGVKFNYRNKRSGEHYPAALEHVALTHQPWVDGLPAFGALSQTGTFTPEEQEPEWEGVYMSVEDSTEDDNDGDILPGDVGLDGIPAQFFSTEKPKRKMPTSPAHTRRSRRDPALPEIPETVEQLLASQQVQIEAANRKAEEADARAAKLEGQSVSQGAAIHLSNIAARVNKWQSEDIAPATVAVARDILLAAGPQPVEVTEDNATLTLSVTKPAEKEGDDPTIETQHLSVEGIVDLLLSSVPRFAPGATLSDVKEQLDQLHASQRPNGQVPEKTAKEKADAIMDEAKAMGASGTGVI